jgi:hypothetical protein
MAIDLPTSSQLNARIAELEVAVAATGADVIAADAALKSSFAQAVLDGDMAPAKAAQVALTTATTSHADATTLLIHARDALAKAILREATEARDAAIVALEPLEAEFLAAAAAADAAMQAVEATFRRAVACDAALRTHIRKHRIADLWGGSEFRTGLKVHADQLQWVLKRGMGDDDHVHNDKAVSYARYEVHALRTDVASHTAASMTP